MKIEFIRLLFFRVRLMQVAIGFDIMLCVLFQEFTKTFTNLTSRYH